MQLARGNGAPREAAGLIRGAFLVTHSPSQHTDRPRALRPFARPLPARSSAGPHHRHAVVTTLADAVHAAVRQERAGAPQYVQLRHVRIHHEVRWRGAQVFSGYIRSYRHDHLEVLTLECFETSP